MKMIYNNFDGLDVSFQGAFPAETLSALEQAREIAKTSQGKSCVIKIGRNEQTVSVFPSGAKGGYAFCFDTGVDGATWFIKGSQDPEGWNIRVSLKSLNLALNGYQRAKENLLGLLDNFDVSSNFYDDNGEILPPTESVARIDYCFDFMMDDFSPSPENFVVHSRSLLRGVRPPESDTDLDMIEVNIRSGKLESITVGKMPNRQVIIYDKTLEIRRKNKPYWWDIWGLKPEEVQGKIWRVEARAAKNEMTNWNVHSFRMLELCMGDIIARILKDMRYVIPSEDTNRSRWPLHPLWEACQSKAAEALAPYTSNAQRKKIVKDLRANLITRAEKNLCGSIATYNHLLGNSIDEIGKTLETVNETVSGYALRGAFRRKIKQAEDRYVFLEDEGDK